MFRVKSTERNNVEVGIQATLELAYKTIRHINTYKRSDVKVLPPCNYSRLLSTCIVA